MMVDPPAMKLRMSRDVRDFLSELAAAVDRYMELTEQLADPTLATNTAVDAGAEREWAGRAILGCAYRVTQAARGKDPKARRMK